MSIVVYQDVATPIVPTPLTLQVVVRFGSAIAGMYDFTRTEGLYQDASGTIPVTEHGQPIGLASDLGGADRHLSQPTTAARPTFTAQGARHDGVDDFLQAALADDWTFLHDGSGGTLAWAGELEETDRAYGRFIGTYTSSNANGIAVGVNNPVAGSARTQRGASTGSNQNVQSPDGVVPFEEMRSFVGVVGTDQSLWVDGVPMGSDPLDPSPSGETPTHPLRTSTIVSGGAKSIRRIIAIREAVTDPADIALLDAWLREGA